MPRVVSVVIASVALVAMMTGCGSSSSSSGSGAKGASVEPCSLVTAAEVSAALGAPVGPPTAKRTGVPGCVFTATGADHAGDGVQVQHQEASVFDGTWSGRHDPGIAGSFVITAVADLGDQAFFQTPKRATAIYQTILGVKQDGTVIYVSVSDQDLSDAQVKAAELRLARHAVRRL